MLYLSSLSLRCRRIRPRSPALRSRRTRRRSVRPLRGQCGEMLREVRGVAAHQSAAEMSEPPGGDLGHLRTIGVRSDEADHLLQGHPDRPDGRQEIGQIGPTDATERSTNPRTVERVPSSSCRFRRAPTGFGSSAAVPGPSHRRSEPSPQYWRISARSRSRRATRAGALSPSASPNLSNSWGHEPHPMPNSNRPPEASARVTASLASTAG